MITSRFVSSLRRDSVRTFFEASPAARLLRSDNAPLVLDFLHRVFKSGELISIGQTDLRIRLSNYQEEIHATEPSLIPGPPERYLTHWVDSGWLQRFLEAASVEPQFQLTRYAEEAIQFVDSAVARGSNLVGTESRLRLVIDTLEDIVRGASADPDRRLDYLKAQRSAIDEEIRAIESGKSVQTYRPAQIRERFQNAVDFSRPDSWTCPGFGRSAKATRRRDQLLCICFFFVLANTTSGFAKEHRGDSASCRFSGSARFTRSRS